tara:strand:+ start:4129 stop:4569 length:441 start_codon:yes stop_codon:yes gene_type:complete
MDELDKLQQRKAALQRKERALKEKQRKTENARKYKLGGMVVKAGLDTLNDEEIIGLLFKQKDALAKNDSIKQEWHDRCIEASKKPDKVGVIVKFTDKPDTEITKKLKAEKLRWNRISKQWEGTFPPEKVDHIRTIAGTKNVSEIAL